MAFIGRQQELEALNKLLKKTSASLVVVQGRRRVGKSRLIEKFAKQLSIQTGLPEIQADDWNKLFLLLAEKALQGRVIILFDEITWMGSKDPDFLGKLKNAWDIYFKKNPQLILILCGSVSVWIDKNILSSTGFVGRISYRLTLEELPLSDCNQFGGRNSKNISAYEKFKILAVTGRIPRYLEEMKLSLSTEENIKDMCFIKGSALVNEFNEIFSDLFSKQSTIYKKIVQTLSQGSLNIQETYHKLNTKPSGFISEYLENLIKSGFITRDYTWHLKSSKISKLSHFRLSDNYLRFYLKYIDKNKYKIENNAFDFKSLHLLSNWEIILALQFENLVLKNRAYIKQCLNLKSDDIETDNPFFQRKTLRTPGCQIDYLIQTRFRTLYVCEIKFKKTKNR